MGRDCNTEDGNRDGVLWSVFPKISQSGADADHSIPDVLWVVGVVAE